MTAPTARRSIIPPPISAEAPKKKRAKPWNGKVYRRTVLEREGWILFEDVERHLAFGHVTYDFLGFADLLLVHPVHGWVLENICVKGDLAAHVTDALGNKKIGPKWLALGRVFPGVPFSARVVAYPNRPQRLAGDFTPRIVPIVLGADGRLRAVDYP